MGCNLGVLGVLVAFHLVIACYAYTFEPLQANLVTDFAAAELVVVAFAFVAAVAVAAFVPYAAAGLN